jgi:hypothetical protein
MPKRRNHPAKEKRKDEKMADYDRKEMERLFPSPYRKQKQEQKQERKKNE